MKKITKDNKTLFYLIEEKPNKHTYFKPKNGYLLVTKAKKMSIKQIEAHLYKNFSKYLNATKAIDELTLSLWGNKYQLEIKENKTFNYEIIENKIIVYNPYKNIKQTKIMILAEEMEKYLIENRKNIIQVLKDYKLNEVPITLKYLTSKFGSYHYLTNKIVINVFLATLEKPFTNYVIYHEYAHQKERNHQKGFYNLLEKLFSNYKIYDKKLKKIIVKI